MDREAYGKSFRIQYENTDSITGRVLAEDYGSRGYVVQNPPAAPLTEGEMDDVYELPYMRAWHPHIRPGGRDPGFFRDPFFSHQQRGCFGGCNSAR